MKSLLFLCSLLAWETGQDQKNTALLRTVPQVLDLTERAPALVKQGKYEAALDIYEPLLKNFPNHTVPLSPEYSVGVRSFITAQISGWPREGKNAYRKRYDPGLREKYEQALLSEDLDLLEEITLYHPFSSVAISASLLQAQLLLDRGAPKKAAQILTILLEREFDQTPFPIVAAQLGLALSLAGNRSELQSLVEEIKSRKPEESIALGTKKTGLLDYVTSLLENFSPTQPSPLSVNIPEWPVMGGALDGNGKAEANIPLGRQAWQLTVSSANYEFSNRSRFRMQTQSQEEFLPHYPVVSDGIVYIHNEYSISALPLFSKGVDLLWTFRLPRPPGTLLYDDRGFHTSSIQNGRVYTSLITKLGQAEERLGYVRVKFPFPTRTLFALNAYTGKEIWKNGGEKGFSFPTQPTPDGDRLYVGGIKQENNTDPFEHYLVCLDSASGKILWKTFIASGLTEINLFGNSTRESCGSPVAIKEDTLYYTTNHGVFAAVDRRNGQLKWVHRYKQLPVRPTRSIQINNNPLEWRNATPIVTRERVIFTPTDSRHLYVLDRQTGAECWNVQRRSDVRVLYGVEDNTVVVGGANLRFYHLQTGRLLDTFQPRSPGRGRGVLSSGEIYMPTRSGFHRINLSSRSSTSFTRWKGSRSQGGNLIIVDGAVLLAGTSRIEAYFDRRNFEKEAEALLKQNPGHIGILYRSAVRLSQSGKDEKALPLFEKVYAAGISSTRPEEIQLRTACQLRLYRIYMRLGGKAVAEKKEPEAITLFQKALLYTNDPLPQWKTTEQLSHLMEKRGNPTRAITLLVNFLHHSEDETINHNARAGIKQLLKKYGRVCYEPIEKRAENAFSKARKQGTPEAFLQVNRLYPNSQTAQKAVLKAIDLYQKRGQNRSQAVTLRAFLREYPQSGAAPQVHVALILFLEKEKQYSSALTLLSRLQRLWPHEMVKVADKTVPAKVFATERLARDIYQNTEKGAHTVPLSPPLSLQLEYREKGAGAALLIQPKGPRPESMREYTFLQYRKSITALSAQGKAWSLSLDKPLLFSHFHEQELLLGTSASLLRINPKTGKKIWKYSGSSPMREFTLVGSHICLFTSERQRNTNLIMAINALQGNISWQQSFTGDPSSKIHRSGDLALFVTRYPPALLTYDSETGSPVLYKKLSSGGVLRKIFQISSDQVILYSPHRFLEAWSLRDAKRMWVVKLDLFSSPFPLDSGKHIHIFAQRQGRNITLAGRVEKKTGKFDRLVEKEFLGNIQYTLSGENNLYVVSLDRKNRSLLVSGIDPDTLGTRWTVRYPDTEGTPLPPSVVGEHLVLVRFSQGVNGSFSYMVTLLDQQGNPVQNIVSPFRYQRPPVYIVEEGRIALTADAEVQIYK